MPYIPPTSATVLTPSSITIFGPDNTTRANSTPPSAPNSWQSAYNDVSAQAGNNAWKINNNLITVTSGFNSNILTLARTTDNLSMNAEVWGDLTDQAFLSVGGGTLYVFVDAADAQVFNGVNSNVAIFGTCHTVNFVASGSNLQIWGSTWTNGNRIDTSRLNSTTTMSTGSPMRFHVTSIWDAMNKRKVITGEAFDITIWAVNLNGATAGTFTLSFAGFTTAPIAYNASTATIQAALVAAGWTGSPTVSGSAGNFTITFGSGSATIGQYVTINAASLTGQSAAPVPTPSLFRNFAMNDYSPMVVFDQSVANVQGCNNTTRGGYWGIGVQNTTQAPQFTNLSFNDPVGVPTGAGTVAYPYPQPVNGPFGGPVIGQSRNNYFFAPVGSLGVYNQIGSANMMTFTQEQQYAWEDIDEVVIWHGNYACSPDVPNTNAINVRSGVVYPITDIAGAVFTGNVLPGYVPGNNNARDLALGPGAIGGIRVPVQIRKGDFYGVRHLVTCAQGGQVPVGLYYGFYQGDLHGPINSDPTSTDNFWVVYGTVASYTNVTNAVVTITDNAGGVYGNGSLVGMTLNFVQPNGTGLSTVSSVITANTGNAVTVTGVYGQPPSPTQYTFAVPGVNFTMTLGAQTTASIAFNSADLPAAMQSALGALSNVGVNNVICAYNSAGQIVITFTTSASYTSAFSTSAGTLTAVAVVCYVSQTASLFQSGDATNSYRSIAITGNPSNPNVVVPVLLGTSFSDGFADGGNVPGAQGGWFFRAYGKGPCLNLAKAATSLNSFDCSDYLFNKQRFRRQLMQAGTDILIEHFINESVPVNTHIANILAIANFCRANGKRVWLTTPTIKNNSTDGWTSLANQSTGSATVFGRGGYVDQYDAFCRTNIIPVNGIIDLASVLIDRSTAQNCWTVDSAPMATGAVSSATNTSMTDSGAAWTPSSVNYPNFSDGSWGGNSCIVKITAGAHAGIWMRIAANTANVLSTPSTDTGWISSVSGGIPSYSGTTPGAGETYQIWRVRTFDGIHIGGYGSQAAAGVAAAALPATAPQPLAGASPLRFGLY